MRPHHLDQIFFQVGFVNRPVVPEEMIRHLQGHELYEPCQLVIYVGQENGVHGDDNIFLENPVDGGVTLYQQLVFPEHIHPDRLFLHGSQGRCLVTQVVQWDKCVTFL